MYSESLQVAFGLISHHCVSNPEMRHVQRNIHARAILRRSMQRMVSRFMTVAALVGLCWGAFLVCSARAEDQNKVVMSLLDQMESSYATVNDYVSVFHKQERVNDKLLPEETIQFKFQKPFKVYMKWIKEPFEGREALYVEGQYNNKLIAHKGG